MPQIAVPILGLFTRVTDPRHPSKVQPPLLDVLTIAGKTHKSCSTTGLVALYPVDTVARYQLQEALCPLRPIFAL